MSMNSVLEGRKLADIQDETREIVVSRELRPEGQSEAQSLILDSWWVFPMSMNSVLEGFRERKLADIQEETAEIVDSRADRPETESDAENEV